MRKFYMLKFMFDITIAHTIDGSLYLNWAFPDWPITNLRSLHLPVSHPVPGLGVWKHAFSSSILGLSKVWEPPLMQKNILLKAWNRDVEKFDITELDGWDTDWAQAQIPHFSSPCGFMLYYVQRPDINVTFSQLDLLVIA